MKRTFSGLIGLVLAVQGADAQAPGSSAGSIILGVYDVYRDDSPNRITSRFVVRPDGQHFKVMADNQVWNGEGEIYGNSGHFEWIVSSSPPRMGRVEFVVNNDGSLRGHTFGSGVDFYFVARPEHAAQSSPPPSNVQGVHGLPRLAERPLPIPATPPKSSVKEQRDDPTGEAIRAAVGTAGREIQEAVDAWKSYDPPIVLKDSIHDPKYPFDFYTRGVLELADGRITVAIADLNRAIRLKLNTYGIFNSLGLAYALNDQLDLAVASFDRAIQINLSATEATKWRDALNAK